MSVGAAEHHEKYHFTISGRKLVGLNGVGRSRLSIPKFTLGGPCLCQPGVPNDMRAYTGRA